MCLIEVNVTGAGTATPPGEKFPGAYGWRDPGLLVNIHYGPKRYVRLLLKFEMESSTNTCFDRPRQGHQSTKENATRLKVPSPLCKKRGS